MTQSIFTTRISCGFILLRFRVGASVVSLASVILPISLSRKPRAVERFNCTPDLFYADAVDLVDDFYLHTSGRGVEGGEGGADGGSVAALISAESHPAAGAMRIR